MSGQSVNGQSVDGLDLVSHFRAMARNNAWSNGRLLSACAALSVEDLWAPRVSFFPSIGATLNHNVLVDAYYLDALRGGGLGASIFADLTPYRDIAAIRARQDATDRDLIAFCDDLGAGSLDRVVLLDRRARGHLPDRVGAILPHLFIHQIHHRGQVHAMLSGTAVKPPQLDEFFLAEDHATAARELAGLGVDPAA